jgi:hypothetical protein
MVRVPARSAPYPGVRKPTEWFPRSSHPSVGNKVVGYHYGSCAFSDMADAIQTASAPEHRIYIAGWSTNKDLVLKTGNSTTLEGYLKQTKAQVRGLFYEPGPLLKQASGVENRWIVDAINALPHGAAVLDGKYPPLGIHHQKILVVQGQSGLIAFIGGMDFDFSRIDVKPAAGLPYHDTQLRITGPAALDCRKVFEDRWLDHHSTPVLDQKLGATATATTEQRRALAHAQPPGDADRPGD